MPWHLNHDLKVENSKGRNFGIIPDTTVYLQMFQSNDRNPAPFYSNPNEAIVFTPCSDHRVIKTRFY